MSTVRMSDQLQRDIAKEAMIDRADRGHHPNYKG